MAIEDLVGEQPSEKFNRSFKGPDFSKLSLHLGERRWDGALPAGLELVTWSSDVSAALCLCFRGGGVLGFHLVGREEPHADNVLKVNEIK